MMQHLIVDLPCWGWYGTLHPLIKQHIVQQLAPASLLSGCLFPVFSLLTWCSLIVECLLGPLGGFGPCPFITHNLWSFHHRGYWCCEINSPFSNQQHYFSAMAVASCCNSPVLGAWRHPLCFGNQFLHLFLDGFWHNTGMLTIKLHELQILTDFLSRYSTKEEMAHHAG